MPRKIIVGLSGGVDSAVSALLLKQQGFEVEGLFMKNWEEDDTSTYCSAKADLEEVKRVCQTLNIPLHTANFSQEYWQQVFRHFLAEYQAGRTPNPDILCNKEIKFKAFLAEAKKLGADLIATGHYAQKSPLDDLLKGVDASKDQSYFLYAITQSALTHTLFPVGHLEKTAVRQLAQSAGLSNHSKKDSTGICFIGERNFRDFLKEYLKDAPGLMQTPEGRTVGEHSGLMFYTLGQRQGLKIGGQKNALEKPWFVVGKNITSNILFVSQEETHPWHFSTKVQVHDLDFIKGLPPTRQFSASAKVRYRQADQACQVEINPRGEINTLEVIFPTPQKAVTPGQSLVLYQGNICLGGGIIHRTDSLGGLNT